MGYSTGHFSEIYIFFKSSATLIEMIENQGIIVY